MLQVKIYDAQANTDREIGAFQISALQLRRAAGPCGAVCKFALPSAQFTTIYRRLESMAMVGRRNKKSRASDVRQAQQRYARNESSGRDVQARIAELRSVPREKLADTVFLLAMAAKQQSERIRQSIRERAEAEVEFDPPPNGDLAAYLAEEAVSILRHHETDVPTFMDILSNRSCDVGFTVEQRDAVSMLAAMIREQRLEGILEGLRLAGLLNKSPKNRHDDLGS